MHRAHQSAGPERAHPVAQNATRVGQPWFISLRPKGWTSPQRCSLICHPEQASFAQRRIWAISANCRVLCDRTIARLVRILVKLHHYRIFPRNAWANGEVRTFVKKRSHRRNQADPGRGHVRQTGENTGQQRYEAVSGGCPTQSRSCLGGRGFQPGYSANPSGWLSPPM